MTATITPTQLAERLASGGCRLIDVRTPIEFREVHVAGAINVPLDQLTPAQFAGAEGEIYTICRSGARGGKACDQLSAAGIADVVNVEGGTLACVEAGLTVIRGAGVISLERQVRIAAGSLVVVGVLLGVLVHPYWLALSGFVGAGLVFAGVTNTCGMGLMLAKMPWNNSVAANSTGSSCALK
jgi:rhodanese-related sulfurtransferase